MIVTKEIEVEEHIKKHTKKIIDEEYCDTCHELLPIRKFPMYNNKKNCVAYRAFEVTTGHRDWGNDSCESRETKQFCCIECAYEYLKEHFKDCSDTYYADIEIQEYYKK